MNLPLRSHENTSVSSFFFFLITLRFLNSKAFQLTALSITKYNKIANYIIRSWLWWWIHILIIHSSISDQQLLKFVCCGVKICSNNQNFSMWCHENIWEGGRSQDNWTHTDSFKNKMFVLCNKYLCLSNIFYIISASRRGKLGGGGS